MRVLSLLLLLACTFAALPGAVQAQPVQRCIGPDGRAVYTDRRCDDVGAVQRLPPPTAAQGARTIRGGCPRQLSQLVGEIGAAIQAHDVNRLSAIYDWRGVPGATATRLFDQLEGIVERPLVDIAPVYRESGPVAVPEPAEPVADRRPDATPAAASAGPAAWMPSWRQVPAAPVDDASPDPAPPPVAPPPRPYPVGLRIEQTLARSATPVRTVFGLRRAYGCFWIAL